YKTKIINLTSNNHIESFGISSRIFEDPTDPIDLTPLLYSVLLILGSVSVIMVIALTLLFKKRTNYLPEDNKKNLGKINNKKDKIKDDINTREEIGIPK
ncbi:MAG: hypothetical protein ACFFCE_19020, partial [Promethearchaeota archaeon]